MNRYVDGWIEGKVYVNQCLCIKARVFSPHYSTIIYCMPSSMKQAHYTRGKIIIDDYKVEKRKKEEK